MKNAPQGPADRCVEFDAVPGPSMIDGWRLWEYPIVDSTNLVSAALGAWEAVRADRQTAGRGRFQRSWVSDEGGLWLSAVVPTDAEGRAGGKLPLVAGLAVCDALGTLGVQPLRMRWPNDLLVNDRKLAGLLIDQFTSSQAVIGIGINVLNHPETCDPSLNNQTVRLVDLVSQTPSVGDVTALVLRNLRQVMNELAAGNLQSLLPRVNKLWGPPRRVELDLDGEIQRGVFRGVDEEGRLILSDEFGSSITYDSWQVRHLKEID